ADDPLGVVGRFIYDPRVSQLAAHQEAFFDPYMTDFWLARLLLHGHHAATALLVVGPLAMVGGGLYLLGRSLHREDAGSISTNEKRRSHHGYGQTSTP